MGNRNDYDAIAEDLQRGIQRLTGNIFVAGGADTSNSRAVDKDALLDAITLLQRTHDWIKGHAEAHRNPIEEVQRP